MEISTAISSAEDGFDLSQGESLNLERIYDLPLLRSLVRRSTTLPNFLNTNEYSTFAVANSSYIAWVNSTLLNIQPLLAKLRLSQRHSVNQLSRSEVRFAKQPSTKVNDSINVITKCDHFMHDKYGDYQVISTHNSSSSSSIKQLELVDIYLIYLDYLDNLFIVNLSADKPAEKRRMIKNTSLLHSLKVPGTLSILPSCNESDTVYVKSTPLSNSNRIGSTIIEVSCSTGCVRGSFAVKNFNLRIGDHNQQTDRMRVYRISSFQFLLFSSQNFLHFISADKKQQQTQIQLLVVSATVVSTHFIENLHENFILSKLEHCAYVISHMPVTQQNSCMQSKDDHLQVYLLLQSTQSLSNDLDDLSRPQEHGTSIMNRCRWTESKKSLYQTIKHAWSLSILRGITDQAISSHLRGFMLSKIQRFLTANQLVLTDFLHFSVIALFALKPRRVVSLLQVIQRVLPLPTHLLKAAERSIYNSLPLYDRDRAKNDPDYRKSFLKMQNSLQSADAGGDLICELSFIDE